MYVAISCDVLLMAALLLSQLSHANRRVLCNHRLSPFHVTMRDKQNDNVEKISANGAIVATLLFHPHTTNRYKSRGKCCCH